MTASKGMVTRGWMLCLLAVIGICAGLSSQAGADLRAAPMLVYGGHLFGGYGLEDGIDTRLEGLSDVTAKGVKLANCLNSDAFHERFKFMASRGNGSGRGSGSRGSAGAGDGSAGGAGHRGGHGLADSPADGSGHRGGGYGLGDGTGHSGHGPGDGTGSRDGGPMDGTGNGAGKGECPILDDEPGV